jgi:hypothetical protein
MVGGSSGPRPIQVAMRPTTWWTVDLSECGTPADMSRPGAARRRPRAMASVVTGATIPVDAGHALLSRVNRDPAALP